MAHIKWKVVRPEKERNVRRKARPQGEERGGHSITQQYTVARDTHLMMVRAIRGPQWNTRHRLILL